VTRSRRIAAIASSLLLGLLVVPAAPAMARTTATKTAKTTKTTAAKKTTTAKTTTVKTSAAATTTVKAAAVVTTPTLATRLAQVKAAKTLNYYPDNAGWSKMWTNFNATQINADLAKAQALGANDVRVILFPTTMGYPAPGASYLDKLNQFVTMAASHGLTVKFTLFDWWDGYSDVAGSTAWAKAVLTPYKDDPRVISVEVKNELDATDTAATTWARKMVPAIRSIAPAMPLTFSVSGTAGVTGLSKIKSATATTPVDFYDFHFYGNSERALAGIRSAQATVAPAPMVIGEVGLNTLQNTEGEQAAYLARVFEAAKVAGVGSLAPWTLNDFEPGAIPSSQVAQLPAQYEYGLYHTDGSAKPAAAVVKAEWTGTALPASLLDPGFELTADASPWTAYLPGLGVGVRTTSAAHSGKQSISFTRTGKDASGAPSIRVAPITPVQPGQKWHAEVWAKGSAATGQTQVALSWFDANDKWLGGASSANLPTGTTGWTKLSIDGIAPAGSASLQVHLKSGDNSGTIWFDDFSIGNS
jgi:hypothetical protein